MTPRPAAVTLWFWLNLAVGICPLPYWMVGRSDARVMGCPIAILYCVGLLISITACLFALYRADDRRGYFVDTDPPAPGTPPATF
ncbi:hypothetical protein AA103196_0343 [Ameyamaea chiangmaiensis NBRC 103196]|uniref:DUF3311 domain-containing protein n=1 Tax=Ameyamaea chiangmaiensis TaxID=442969 RepID=A0A850P675_9PROT|nr:hypothetical protein [Ameyamaea chiangmaiensis]MBS4074740.1 hypothetical protein [Ameyamaea chiangmaiensis]NVN40145.1 hypothetical protein [Ameyamaea chiangmaiensis]GBQ62571.1 hypothetical protein AA103196_0343 [Ameyamaea chiangmaiensis NBRC 103196]